MDTQVRPRDRVGSSLSMIGGLLVVWVIYWAPWWSSTYPHLFRDHGPDDVTLYQLPFYYGLSGWHLYVSQVMALGAIVLIASGVMVTVASGSRLWKLTCAIGMAMGVAIVVFVSLKAAFIPLSLSDGRQIAKSYGEWIALTGAMFGLSGFVMTISKDSDSLPEYHEDLTSSTGFGETAST